MLVQIYFGRNSPFNFSLPVRLFHHLGLCRTQHARQTKVCKGRRLLLSLGTLLPAAAVLFSRHHHAIAMYPELRGCMYMDGPRALESQPAQAQAATSNMN